MHKKRFKATKMRKGRKLLPLEDCGPGKKQAFPESSSLSRNPGEELLCWLTVKDTAPAEAIAGGTNASLNPPDNLARFAFSLQITDLRRFWRATVVSGQITLGAHVCCPEVFPLGHTGPHPGRKDEMELGFGSQG